MTFISGKAIRNEKQKTRAFNMITKDYVSFETAKLLKEKGFDAECDYLYVDGKLVRALGCACNWNDGETLFADYKNECSAPTLQSAMKWFREKYSLEIYPYHNYDNSKWWYEIIKYPNSVAEYECGKDEELNTYEEACEDAIKYCLENLIKSMEKELYPVFSVDVCFASCAMDYKLIGAKSREDLIENFDWADDQEMGHMKGEDYRIKQIKGLYTDTPYKVLDTYTYYE